MVHVSNHVTFSNLCLVESIEGEPTDTERQLFFPSSVSAQVFVLAPWTSHVRHQVQLQSGSYRVGPLSPFAPLAWVEDGRGAGGSLL